MALVRKTDKLKEEIDKKLTDFQLVKLAPHMDTTIPLMAECILAWMNYPLYPISTEERELQIALHKIRKGYMAAPDRMWFDLIPHRNSEKVDQHFKDLMTTQGASSMRTERDFKPTMRNIDATKYPIQELLLPQQFNPKDFSFFVEGVFCSFTEYVNGHTQFYMSFLTSWDTPEVRPHINTLRCTHIIDDADVKLFFKHNPKLRLKLETAAQEMELGYQAIDKVKDYVFNTLWPGVSSLNAMVKYYPGLTEFCTKETLDRLYKRSGKEEPEIPNHLAPPTDVLVATAKHKLLK